MLGFALTLSAYVKRFKFASDLFVRTREKREGGEHR
jgi:hypothetical protein